MAQLATALILAVAIPVLTGRTIHAIGDDLTRSFLARMIEQAQDDLDHGRLPHALADAVAIYVERDGRLTHLSGPAIDDVLSRPEPRARPAFAHGPHSDFYVVPTGTARTWLIAAEDRRHPAALLDDFTTAFLHRFVVIVPFVLLLSALMSLLAVRHAMRPMHRAAEAASARNPADMAVRLDETDVPLEVLPLVRAANAAFGKLESAYELERAFSSTVVHELRTSLSTILLRAELLSPGNVRSALEEACQRAARVIDQMIELQRVSANTDEHRAAPIEDVIRQTCEEMREQVESGGRVLDIAIVGDGSQGFSFPMPVAAIALRNLIQNADLHSSPAGKISIIGDPAGEAISVVDSGPGIVVREDTDGRLIYSRADGVASRNSGLGIAIVHRLMALIGGTLTFHRNADGGTVAKLWFGPR
ncbi:MAG: HAMP domain-containing histidine kinase [Sphingomonadales bacterium]|nr:HAMP domain-containing histidine kinase [Sphingomonadales bacterium]